MTMEMMILIEELSSCFLQSFSGRFLSNSSILSFPVHFSFLSPKHSRSRFLWDPRRDTFSGSDEWGWVGWKTEDPYVDSFSTFGNSSSPHRPFLSWSFVTHFFHHAHTPFLIRQKWEKRRSRGDDDSCNSRGRIRRLLQHISCHFYSFYHPPWGSSSHALFPHLMIHTDVGDGAPLNLFTWIFFLITLPSPLLK